MENLRSPADLLWPAAGFCWKRKEIEWSAARKDRRLSITAWIRRPFCLPGRRNETRRFRPHTLCRRKKEVLYTGKIRESKGVILFSAMKQVFSKDPKAHLVLAGGTGFGYKRADKKTDFYNRLQREIAPFQDRVLQIPFTPPRTCPDLSVRRYLCRPLSTGRGPGHGLLWRPLPAVFL